MEKINDESVSFITVLNNLPNDMAFELIYAISKWEKIIKSPYGHSYYNAPVSWGFKTPDSLRISDHWNFTSHSKIHCATTKPVPDNTHYTLARYNETLEKYEPIRSYCKLTTSVKGLISYKLLKFKAKREVAIKEINTHITDNIKLIEVLAKQEITYAEKLLKLI